MLLPSEGESKQKLLAHIERQVLQLVDQEHETRRDPSGIVLGLLLIVIGAWLSLLIGRTGGWWWLFSPCAGFVLLLGIVGLTDAAGRSRRNEKGRKVPSR